MFDKRLAELAVSRDPDATFIDHFRRTLEGGLLNPPEHRVGNLRCLLVGYQGAGNVGSDMRSNEIVRQVKHIVGELAVTFSTLVGPEEIPTDVLQGVRRIRLGGYLPDDVARGVDDHDCVLASEGSMFKSNFSNALSSLMAAALGRASRVGKIAVGYGAEVAGMDPALERFVLDAAGGVPIFCRSASSLRAACSVGLDGRPGADTAWTFEAAPPERAGKLMREFGWDGEAPILTVCPANPFWWPVRPSLQMAMSMQRTGEYAHLCHGSIFFHADSVEINRKYRKYVEQLADAASRIAREKKAFTLLVAMERMDAIACEAIATAVFRSSGKRPPIVIGHKRLISDVVGLLRQSTLLISSRFHAIVASLPGLVPTIGVANDERIRNLLGDGDAANRIIDAADPDLCERIIAVSRQLEPEHAAASADLTVRREMRAMGEMGLAFADEIRRLRPDVELPDRPRLWRNYLPPVSAALDRFLDD